MSAITAQIIDKLHHLEKVSQPTLTLILDFINVVESRLTKESNIAVESVLQADVQEVSCFDLTQELIGISDELPEDLSTNPEHMAGYGL